MISGLWKKWSRLMKTGPRTAHRPIKTGLYQSGPVKGIFGPVLDRSRSRLSPIWVEKPDWTGLLNTTPGSHFFMSWDSWLVLLANLTFLLNSWWWFILFCVLMSALSNIYHLWGWVAFSRFILLFNPLMSLISLSASHSALALVPPTLSSSPMPTIHSNINLARVTQLHVYHPHTCRRVPAFTHQTKCAWETEADVFALINLDLVCLLCMRS